MPTRMPGGTAAISKVRAILFLGVMLGLGSALSEASAVPAQEDARYPVPVEGSMRDLIRETVGSFALESSKVFVQMLGEGATDAMILLYRTQDGIEIYHILSAFASSEASQAYLAATVQGLQSQGFNILETSKILNESNEEIGDLSVMGGPSSIFVWTNGELFLLVTGPQEHTRGFYDGLVPFY